jgi:exodeoxyribonuclease VII large subunit
MEAVSDRFAAPAWVPVAALAVRGIDGRDTGPLKRTIHERASVAPRLPCDNRTMNRDEPPDWALPSWDALPAEAIEPRPGAASAGSGAPPRAPGTFGVRILRVTEVARAIRETVRADERLRDVWVEGEVGRVTISSAGHAYFALKDERSQLQCVWFRDERLRSAFEPQAGLRIVAHGRVDLFEPQGALQLYVESIQPAGVGDLALRFEALKASLAAEGLFDAARKRPLPPRPATIAVVTSPSGAVWRDICQVVARRWPLTRVVLVACRVQGADAPPSIVAALRRLEAYVERCRADGRPDEAPAVTILARGGGSLEDLWPFNDERVVRAVVAHRVPVVSGVGHEIDVTLVDFAADVRAPTPSAAAELVVPDRTEFAIALGGFGRRMRAAVTRSVAAAAGDLTAERRALDRLRPEAQLAAARERAGMLLDRASAVTEARLARDRDRLERAAGRLPALIATRVAGDRGTLDAAAAALAVLGPQATLDRGYAIVRRRDDETIVRDPASAPSGTPLRLRLAGGELAAPSDGAGEG